ncbi:LysR family transcriptional regulator [Ktedonospora formicarum]|uniref:LysR family transcriptional regulator n=1 Tax=Ktedonospora formicarum TaxID=2778364 RepID=A0A8J3I2T8_9CHLR|nr:LysR family transcriptional regulator [Ktedonospora formicarum]GHO46561.1 LysR family transcriptional regulator [Ktedonospora formicarum]
MEFRQLTYFLTAAQTQNFRKAADLCYVAQPALSRQIAALEEELGITLFRRVKQRVVLTPAGQEFANYVKSALDTLQQGQFAMSRLQQGQGGTLSIGCNESLATALLPEVFSRFRGQYPDVRMKVSVNRTDEVISLVEQGEVDLGLIFDPDVRSEIVVLQELFRQQLQVLVSSEHPLARQEPREITLSRALEEPLILLDESARLRKVLDRIFLQRGFVISPSVEISSVEGLKELVRHGSGITLISPALMRSAHHEGLTLLPISDLQEEFIYALVYRRFGTLSLLARQFIDIVLKTKTLTE